jgi:hypothetical protein
MAHTVELTNAGPIEIWTASTFTVSTKEAYFPYDCFAVGTAIVGSKMQNFIASAPWRTHESSYHTVGNFYEMSEIGSQAMVS